MRFRTSPLICSLEVVAESEVLVVLEAQFGGSLNSFPRELVRTQISIMELFKTVNLVFSKVFAMLTARSDVKQRTRQSRELPC